MHPTKNSILNIYLQNNIMKQIILTAAAIILFYSCTKKETTEAKEKACPTIDQGLVPAAVKSSFQNKYPSNSVITWFRKDSIGYCAYFLQSASIKKLAEFDNTGLFVKEETDNNQKGNFEDSTKVNGGKGTGCECEMPE